LQKPTFVSSRLKLKLNRTVTISKKKYIEQKFNIAGEVLSVDMSIDSVLFNV